MSNPSLNIGEIDWLFGQFILFERNCSRLPLDEVVSVSLEEIREVEGLIVIQSDTEDEFNS